MLVGPVRQRYSRTSDRQYQQRERFDFERNLGPNVAYSFTQPGTTFIQHPHATDTISTARD